MKTKNELRRPITSTDLFRKKFNVLQFEGKWKEFIGCPEVKGSWIIYGDGANGKTRLMLQMAKYLGNFGKVYINSLEEGESESIKRGWIEEDIDSTRDHVYLLDKEPFEQTRQRLTMRNSPDFVFFDSVQFMQKFTQEEYNDLLNEFPNKLFIFTSHVTGKEPKGSLANAIYYRSFVKFYVEGFRAFAKTRYEGNTPFDIWPEKAFEYWSKAS